MDDTIRDRLSCGRCIWCHRGLGLDGGRSEVPARNFCLQLRRDDASDRLHPFFLLMNSAVGSLGMKSPRGGNMTFWNVLMSVCHVLGALAAAATAIYDKATDKDTGSVLRHRGIAHRLRCVRDRWFYEEKTACVEIFGEMSRAREFEVT